VYEWLNDSGRSAPRNELQRHGFTAVATALSGRQSGAVETREGIYETARTAAQCLRDPQIMAWITPPATGEVDPDSVGECPLFDPDGFAASSDTLYLLSKEGGGSAAPLVAAFVDRVIRAGTRRAEQAAGRMDPPLLLCLDECANIVKISDLPDLYSHLGSRGIIPVTILQSAEQGEQVWGREGFATLWSAATVKVIGAGIDSAKMAEDISKLIGDHDVAVRSSSHGRDSTTSTSLRQQRIIPADRVRALPKGQALVLATGVKAALVQGLPWYGGDRAERIAADLAAAHAAIRHRARQGSVIDLTTESSGSEPTGDEVPVESVRGQA
jgi:TraM recognition site of TraD and TraG